MVFPDDSGPKISITRPWGRPPIPSAISKPIEPVDTQGISTISRSPIFITVPFPNCFSICESVSVRFLSLSDIIYSLLYICTVYYKIQKCKLNIIRFMLTCSRVIAKILFNSSLSLLHGIYRYRILH